VTCATLKVFDFWVIGSCTHWGWRLRADFRVLRCDPFALRAYVIYLSPFLVSVGIDTQTRVLMTNWGGAWPCFAASKINASNDVILCIDSACAGVQPLGAKGMYQEW